MVRQKFMAEGGDEQTHLLYDWKAKTREKEGGAVRLTGTPSVLEAFPPYRGLTF
jgi:hypothetical protein